MPNDHNRIIARKILSHGGAALLKEHPYIKSYDAPEIDSGTAHFEMDIETAKPKILAAMLAELREKGTQIGIDKRTEKPELQPGQFSMYALEEPGKPAATIISVASDLLHKVSTHPHHKTGASAAF